MSESSDCDLLEFVAEAEEIEGVSDDDSVVEADFVAKAEEIEEDHVEGNEDKDWADMLKVPERRVSGCLILLHGEVELLRSGDWTGMVDWQRKFCNLLQKFDTALVILCPAPTKTL